MTRQPRRSGLALLALAVLLLGGCAGGLEWVREGVRFGEFSRDRQTCYEEARSYGFLYNDHSSVTGPGTQQGFVPQGYRARYEADLHRLCMNRMGGSGATDEGDPEAADE